MRGAYARKKASTSRSTLADRARRDASRFGERVESGCEGLSQFAEFLAGPVDALQIGLELKCRERLPCTSDWRRVDGPAYDAPGPRSGAHYLYGQFVIEKRERSIRPWVGVGTRQKVRELPKVASPQQDVVVTFFESMSCGGDSGDGEIMSARPFRRLCSRAQLKR